MIDKVLTPEEIATQYRNTMDSVNLVNSAKPEYMDEIEWLDCISRNKQHIMIMLSKDYWTTENLTPFEDAIK